MLNPFKDINWKPKPADLRSFGCSLMMGLPALALAVLLLIAWRQYVWPVWPLWLAGIGVAAGALFYAIPPLARPVYLVWHFFAACVGLVLGNVILAAVFYLAVTPIGLVLRLFGRDPMRRKLDRSATSYWLDAGKVRDSRSYFRQF